MSGAGLPGIGAHETLTRGMPETGRPDLQEEYMSFWDDATEELARPLSRDHVKERAQAGRKLSYIEGWHAIAEANRIFGFGSWQRETLECRCVSERERGIGSAQKPGWSVSYIARVRVTVAGVVRDGTGAGHGIDVDLGLAHESAIKEAETDAMKRALMTFGNPFGLALYDKEQAMVEDDGNEASKPKPKPKAQPPKDMPPFDPLAAFERVKARVAAAKTVDDLTALWKAEAETIAEISGARPEAHGKLVEAFKARKAALSASYPDAA